MDFSKAEKLIAFNMPLMQLCVYACILTVSWLSAHLVVGGSMDVGQLTSMFSYIMMILREPDDALHGAGHDHPGPRLMGVLPSCSMRRATCATGRIRWRRSRTAL